MSSDIELNLSKYFCKQQKNEIIKSRKALGMTKREINTNIVKELNKHTAICLTLAKALDNGGIRDKKANQSEKDKRTLPQLDDREHMARTANKIASLCRGGTMDAHDEKMGYKREYIIASLATQLEVMASNYFRESFIS